MIAKNMSKFLLVVIVICCVVVSACTSDEKKEVPPVENPVQVELIRLEKQLFNFKSKEEVSTFLKANPAFTKLYLQLADSMVNDQLVDFIYEFYGNPMLKSFYQTTDSSFGDMHEIQAQFADMFSRIQLEDPNFVVPKIYTVVTGFRFDKDIAFSDSAIVISIDYFLGEKAAYRPNHYEYFLKRYEKPYIVPMVGLAISTKYNKGNVKDNTMLANMVFYGKSHYFLERVMPNLPDTLNIMYSQKELTNAQEHLGDIWGHFVDRKLLFETSHRILENYVGEAPATNEISKDCPGRIGRWLGWEIVRAYMKKNSSVSLLELMNNQDAKIIFEKSEYRPEVKLKEEKKQKQ